MSDQADAEFRDFMAARWPGLVRLSYGLTGDQALAEDLAQTALVKAYAAWPRVRRADSPDAYVRRIVINTNSSRMRSRRFSEHLMPSLPDHGAPDETGQHDDRSALVAALMTLPARQRAVVVLRYWLDLTESPGRRHSRLLGRDGEKSGIQGAGQAAAESGTRRRGAL